MSHRHALVFGGSGISGWAVTQAALAGDTFSRVTCITNRPLGLQDGLFPQDPRLRVINGVDLTLGLELVKTALQEKVPDVHTVTHIFFLAYAARLPDYVAEEQVNVHATQVAIQSVTTLAPDTVQHITLQTGGKWYGVHIPDECGKLAAPICEDVRFGPPHDGKIFYYAQYDAVYALWAAQRTRKNAWNFTELRPNAIIGFNPQPSPMNLAYGLAMYLTLQRELLGAGANVPWPGTQASWHAKTTDASQDMLAAAHVRFALDAKGAAARAGPLNANSFNIADHAGKSTSWASKWPGLCAYFGLVGRPPAPAAAPAIDAVSSFMAENEGTWGHLCERHGLRSREWLQNYSYGFLTWVTHGLDWDISLDVQRVKKAGFTESYDTVGGYRAAFDRMVQARLIPSHKGTQERVSKL